MDQELNGTRVSGKLKKKCKPVLSVALYSAVQTAAGALPLGSVAVEAAPALEPAEEDKCPSNKTYFQGLSLFALPFNAVTHRASQFQQ